MKKLTYITTKVVLAELNGRLLILDLKIRLEAVATVAV